MTRPATQGELFAEPHLRAPWQGRTKVAREASASGARSQVPVWSAKKSALLQVLRNGGPMTRNELAAVLRWPITSVCSQLDALLESGAARRTGSVEIVSWSGGRTTKRERFSAA